MQDFDESRDMVCERLNHEIWMLIDKLGKDVVSGQSLKADPIKWLSELLETEKLLCKAEGEKDMLDEPPDMRKVQEEMVDEVEETLNQAREILGSDDAMYMAIRQYIMGKQETEQGKSLNGGPRTDPIGEPEFIPHKEGPGA